MSVRMSREFQNNFRQSRDTSIRNLADMSTIEIKKLAPYANPAQYPNGYTGVPGTLMRSIKRQGSDEKYSIDSDAGYAIIRNRENNLNPQTRNYINRGIINAVRGKSSQWWRAAQGFYL